MADKPKYDPDTDYVVTGAYVTVKTNNTAVGKPMIVGLYAGAPWPRDATTEAGQHHLDSGLIAPVGAVAPQPGGLASAQAAQPPPAVPAGQPVPDPHAAEKAAAAAAAEEQRILAEAAAGKASAGKTAGGKAEASKTSKA